MVKCITTFWFEICTVLYIGSASEYQGLKTIFVETVFTFLPQNYVKINILASVNKTSQQLLECHRKLHSFIKKIQSRWFAPIVGFFDLESIIESVSGCRNNPQKPGTRIIELHKPRSYAMLFVGQDEVEPFDFECESGAGIVSKFVESLERIAKKVHNAKQQNLYFKG